VERSIFFKPVQHCAGEKKRQVAKDSSAAHSLANRNLREKEREGIRARELPEFFFYPGCLGAPLEMMKFDYTCW
jgi:hypothetical protein